MLPTFPRFRSLGDLLDVEPERKMLQKRLACPPGTLGRLSPHQGFVALPNPERCEQPVWFVPQFEEEPPPPLPPPPVFLPPQLVDPANSERLHRQLQELGHPRRLKAAQWQAALKLFSDTHPRIVQDWLPAAEGIFPADPDHQLTSREKKHRRMLWLEKTFGLRFNKKHYHPVAD